MVLRVSAGVYKSEVCASVLSEAVPCAVKERCFVCTSAGQNLVPVRCCNLKCRVFNKQFLVQQFSVRIFANSTRMKD